jgi:hypothetical protein
MRISREELYSEIWSEPATKVAQRHDVSSSYLARVCEGLNVPHPARGYWARKAAGEKMPIPPLPPAAPGDPLSWDKGVAVLEGLPPLEMPPQPKSKGKAVSPQRPVHHPLVTAWRGFLEEAAPTATGYLVPRKKNVLDAFVTKAMIRGAAEALDAILIELEMRGHRVQLSPEHYRRRPPVDVAQRPIRERDLYNRRPNEWEPGRPTVVFVRGALIGLTFFELTENVRVRRTGTDRYVRITDLPAVRRYAPQSPDETDETRDMPTGRLVLRAYSPLHDTDWQHEWTENDKAEFVTTAKGIADYLEEVEPVIVQQAEEAERGRQEWQKQAEEEERRCRARERAEALRRAQQAAREELRAIVKAWNDAFALEAFFNELSRHAAPLEDRERADLEVRIGIARNLLGGQDAIDRFLKWRIPEASAKHADDRDPEQGDEIENED